VQALTARIAAGLESVTAPFASWEEARLIDRAVDLAVEADPVALPLSERWSLWRAFSARYAALERSDPERAERLVTALRGYDEVRRRLGLRESDLAAWPEHGWRARVRDTLERLAMAPGVLLNWLPYKLPTWIADRLTRTPDEPASYKVMGALLFFPIWWALEAAAAWAVGGPLAALALLVAAPVTGARLPAHTRPSAPAAAPGRSELRGARRPARPSSGAPPSDPRRRQRAPLIESVPHVRPRLSRRGGAPDPGPAARLLDQAHRGQRAGQRAGGGGFELRP
jgi:hypothetical protein